MKVLDLHCPQGHLFEGWFASEEDFQSQLQRQLVLCPVCGHSDITKRLSAPASILAPSLQACPGGGGRACCSRLGRQRGSRCFNGHAAPGA